MAILQAARAADLGLPLDSAYSWGLNRAIFYAAAKRGFKGAGGVKGRGKESQRAAPEEKTNEYFLGDEKAYLSPDSDGKNKPLFEIGDEAQTPKDFERQIISRFGGESNFKKAWSEALKIVKGYDEQTLKSQHEFFEKVYKPRRDELSKKWSELSAAKPKKKEALAASASR